jgi:hypothetical protein
MKLYLRVYISFAVSLFFLVIVITGSIAQNALPYLKVAANKRFLVKEDGKDTPFFWMGDTAWKLLKLKKEEIDHYLGTRAAQGFNLIQGPVVAQKYYEGPFEPDGNGRLPFTDPADPLSFNEAYFQHLDYAVHKAAEQGLYVALVPMWAQGMELYTEAQLKAFGEKLALRYASYGNVLWVAGGEGAGEATPGRVRALAAGLKQGSRGRQLVTVHPNGKKSSSSGRYKTGSEKGEYRFHFDSWLDFNMIQTGHHRDFPNYTLVSGDYQLKPVKPTLEAEYFYEDHPNWTDRHNPDVPRATALDARTGGYWAVFSGSLGYTYGHHAVWLFYEKDEQISFTRPTIDWKTALHSQGAKTVPHLRLLMESRPFQELFPAQELLISIPQDSVAVSKVRVLRSGRAGARDAGCIMVYIPKGASAVVNTSVMGGKHIHTWWFDPTTGKSKPALQQAKNPGEITIRPEAGSQDRVLVVDDAARGYSPPGKE